MAFNVYQIYEYVGWSCPFVVTQSSWGNTAFQVESIDGKTSGELTGKPPYYGNPCVRGFYIDTTTNQKKPDFTSTGVLSCPGNYKWHLMHSKGDPA